MGRNVLMQSKENKVVLHPRVSISRRDFYITAPSNSPRCQTFLKIKKKVKRFHFLSLNSKPVTLSAGSILGYTSCKLLLQNKNLWTSVCFLRWKARDEKEMDEINFLTAYRCTLNCRGSGHESEKFTDHWGGTWTKFWKKIEGH